MSDVSKYSQYGAFAKKDLQRVVNERIARIQARGNYQHFLKSEQNDALLQQLRLNADNFRKPTGIVSQLRQKFDAGRINREFDTKFTPDDLRVIVRAITNHHKNMTEIANEEFGSFYDVGDRVNEGTRVAMKDLPEQLIPLAERAERQRRKLALLSLKGNRRSSVTTIGDDPKNDPDNTLSSRSRLNSTSSNSSSSSSSTYSSDDTSQSDSRTSSSSSSGSTSNSSKSALIEPASIKSVSSVDFTNSKKDFDLLSDVTPGENGHSSNSDNYKKQLSKSGGANDPGEKSGISKENGPKQETAHTISTFSSGKSHISRPAFLTLPDGYDTQYGKFFDQRESPSTEFLKVKERNQLIEQIESPSGNTSDNSIPPKSSKLSKLLQSAGKLLEFSTDGISSIRAGGTDPDFASSDKASVKRLKKSIIVDQLKRRNQLIEDLGANQLAQRTSSKTQQVKMLQDALDGAKGMTKKNLPDRTVLRKSSKTNQADELTQVLERVSDFSIDSTEIMTRAEKTEENMNDRAATDRIRGRDLGR